MKSVQVVTWPRYTAAEKRAHQARLRSRRWRGEVDQQFAELARLQARRDALRELVLARETQR